jgi:hypothetical protein
MPVALCFRLGQFRMSTSDAIVDLAGLVLLWQQNQIFRHQNDIFAAQSGITQAQSKGSFVSRLKRYWPMLLMTVLALFVWAPSIYRYYGQSAQAQPTNSQDSPVAPWLLGVGVVIILGHSLYVEAKRRQQPIIIPTPPIATLEQRPIERFSATESRLTIHSAKYGPLSNPEDVTVAVRAQLRDNKLKQYVSRTLLNGYIKPATLLTRSMTSPGDWYLTVNYSFGELRNHNIVRHDDEWLELPEAEIQAVASRPPSIPTHLRLHFATRDATPLGIDPQNVWRWHAFLHMVRHEKRKGQIQNIHWWTVYLNFDAPTAVKQLKISANGALPIHEVRECNPRFAIIEFSGDLFGLTIDIDGML